MDLICDSLCGTDNNDLLAYLKQNGMPCASVKYGGYNGKTLGIANIRNHLSDVGHYVVLLGNDDNGIPFYWDPYYGKVLPLVMSDWTNGDRTLEKWWVDTGVSIESIEQPNAGNIEKGIIFLADPRETLKPGLDTTLDMERASNELEIPNRFATIQDCLVVNDTLFCNGLPVAPSDTVFIRLDPSLDGRYFDFLRTLCHVNARFINKPQDILTKNDKLFAQKNLSIVLTSDNEFSIKKALQIFKKHNINKLVIKPLSLFGGESIRFVNTDDADEIKVVSKYLIAQFGQVIIEPFISANPAISETPVDTRVVVFNGEIIANADRLPPKNSIICNLSSGGSISARTLSEDEKSEALVAATQCNLNGIMFAGVDLLNGQLSEINISCPGAIKHVSQAVGFDVSKSILERALSQ
jgi:glutathione synthase